MDIDGSYLARKHTSTSSSGLTCAPLPLPDEPPLGWNDVTEENREEMAEQIPAVFPTTLYSYLADGVGNVSGQGAFRALTRGYIHWSSGRLSKMQFNDNNPNYCFVRCMMRPSMRPTGLYKVLLLLQRGWRKCIDCTCNM